MTHADERILAYPIPTPAALEPPTEWEEPRQRCPVARAKLPSGDEVALTTRYADVKQVLSERGFDRRQWERLLADPTLIRAGCSTARCLRRCRRAARSIRGGGGW